MNDQKTSDAEPVNFEKSFLRLEEILEKMNSGTVSLDSALTLYEEADHLITACGKRLNEAELKIETLIKKRNGELALNENQTPEAQTFTPPSQPL